MYRWVLPPSVAAELNPERVCSTNDTGDNGGMSRSSNCHEFQNYS